MHPPAFPPKPTDTLQIIRDRAHDQGWGITERAIERAQQVHLELGGQEAVFNVFHNGMSCVLRAPEGNQEIEALIALLKSMDLFITSSPIARPARSVHPQARVPAEAPTPQGPIQELDQMISTLRNRASTAASFLWEANETYRKGSYLACSMCLGLSTKSLVQTLVLEIAQNQEIRACIGNAILDPRNSLASLRKTVSTSRSRPECYEQLMAVIEHLDELADFATPWLDQVGTITIPEFHDQSVLRAYALRRCLHMQQALDGVTALLGS